MEIRRANGKDRRRFMRWDCSIPCRLNGNGEEFETTIVNLSFNGACLETIPANVTKGDRVDLRFSAEGESVHLEGRIVHTVASDPEKRVGIEFEGSWEEKVAKVMPVFRLFISEDDSFAAQYC